MARSADGNLRKEVVLKDKDKEAYNGYISTTIPSLDRANFTSWNFLNGHKLRLGPVESGTGFIIVCVFWLLFASIPESLLESVCSVLQRIAVAFLPLLCLICVFFWVELLIQKYCKTCVSYVVFPVCVVGEVCTQLILDGSDFLRTTFLFVLILAGLVMVVLSKLKFLPTCTVLVLLTLARISSWLSLSELPSFLRPFLAYVSAFSGLILSRNVQSWSSTALLEVEGKTPMLRRRTSSVSSTSSLRSTQRRTSLPALGIQNKSSMDYTTLGEAHGMISDLLADSSLPPNIASTLKIISTMIAVPSSFHPGQRPFVSPMSPLIERFRDEHMEEKVKDQPDLKEDMPLPMVGRIRRSLNSPGRRMSSTWTTTTSATGMPTVDPDLSVRLESAGNTPLSSSPRSPSPLIHGSSGSRSSPKLGAVESPTVVVKPPGSSKANSQENAPKRGALYFPNSFTPQGSPVIQRKLSPDGAPPSFATRRSADHVTSSPSLLRKSPDRMGGAFRRVSREEVQFVQDALEKATAEGNEHDHERVHACSCKCHGQQKASKDDNESDSGESTQSGNELEEFDLPSSKELDELLDRLNDWNFPIFKVFELQGNVLCQVAYRVFKNVGFFAEFKIPERNFLNYFFALESGYHDIPYHNALHASDVLHGVYYMTTGKIPGFCPLGTPPKLSSDDSDSDMEELGGLKGKGYQAQSDNDYGCLMDFIPSLELLSLFTAAAMHDYDHPGRTNAFLVATLSQQALLYNDRSVLENHHAASAFTLLMSDPKYNFLCGLESAQFKRFRFLAIEAILATDLKRHFDLLSEFNAKLSEEGGGIDWTLEADRLLTLQMCIKMADISGPSKVKDLHTKWTEKIVEEFYEQGDDELARGMPVSPYMDRNQPHVAQLQESFINHLVAPLFNTFHTAGLLPGVWVDVTVGSFESESDLGESGDESLKVPDVGRRKSKKSKHRKQRNVRTEMTSNIESNYKFWVAKIKHDQKEKKTVKIDVGDKGSDNDEDEAEFLQQEPLLQDEVIEEGEENGLDSSSGSTREMRGNEEESGD